MAFFNQAINILQTLVVAIGAGLAVWGVINLLEAADGGRRCCFDRHPACTVTFRFV